MERKWAMLQPLPPQPKLKHKSWQRPGARESGRTNPRFGIVLNELCSLPWLQQSRWGQMLMAICSPQVYSKMFGFGDLFSGMQSGTSTRNPETSDLDRSPKWRLERLADMSIQFYLQVNFKRWVLLMNTTSLFQHGVFTPACCKHVQSFFLCVESQTDFVYGCIPPNKNITKTFHDCGVIFLGLWFSA